MWILIIILAIWLSYGFYWYAYVFNVAQVEIISNQNQFEITLTNQNQVISKKCDHPTCILENIPPFNFELIAQKDWFTQILKTVKFSRNVNQINLDFQQDFSPILVEEELTQVDIDILNQLDNTTNLIDKKREEIQKAKNLYFKQTTQNNIYYFYENLNNDNVVVLWKNDTVLWNIPKIPKNTIEVVEIIWNDNEFLIKNNSAYILFSIWNNTYRNFDFKIPIYYAKKVDAVTYIISSDKWAFTWKKDTDTFEYNHLFDDFIIYQNSYIWYIWKNNISLKNKVFWDKEILWEIIYQYFPLTKEKNILFEWNIEINKIFISEEKIYIEDKNNLLYKIPHL